MTSQGSGDGLGRAPDDDTRMDWTVPSSLPTPPVAPPAPPVEPPPPPPPAVPGSPGGVWAPPSSQPGEPGPSHVPGVSGIRFAGALPRVLAWWLDSLIVAVIAGITGGILGVVLGNPGLTTVVVTVVAVGITLLYFVAMWTGDARATLGMRLFHLQIGNASDGQTLTVSQGLTRWVALGLPLQAAAVVPLLAPIASAVIGLWSLVLLVSTIASPTRQGLHDRIAGSAIVAPIGRDGPVVPCLVLLVLLMVVLPIVSIVALILLGTQASQILSSGTSI
jgi:uncharacterized RDD family membrane protein YckC